MKGQVMSAIFYGLRWSHEDNILGENIHEIHFRFQISLFTTVIFDKQLV